MKNLYTEEIGTLIGKLRIICDDRFIIRLLFEKDNLETAVRQMTGFFGEIRFCEKNEVTHICAGELRDYFQGKSRTFTVKPWLQGSAYELRIWEGLQRIPYASTRSYAEHADLCGLKGARAAGGAVGRNPVPIIVPCHRVIRSDGGIGGYRGGTENKTILLDLERQNA